jgi:uncharacterized protein YwqG
MPTKYRVVTDESEDDETPETGALDEEVHNQSREAHSQSEDDSKKDAKTERQERKAKLEAELAGLEDEIKEEASEAAENIAENDPERGEVASEAKDEAAAIATGKNLTKDEEDRLAKSIAAKVMEQLGNASKPDNRPPRTPDRRPKPTHWSEKKILGRSRKAA